MATAVHAKDLAALLGLSIAAVQTRMRSAGARPERGTGGGARYAWDVVERALDPGEIARLRRTARALGFRVSSATWTLAGYPALIAEWHPTKNGETTPWDVSFGSAKRVWWRCPRGTDHVWSSEARTRVRGSGCPFCAGQRLSVTTSLASCFPEIAAQWHPTKNGKRLARDVLIGSSEQAWWKCPRAPDHEWRTRVSSRTASQSGCPFCAGHGASSTTSLAAVAPAVAAEWHPTKNGTTRPEQVAAGTPKKYWWRCTAGHAWQAQVRSRALLGCQCPRCYRLDPRNRQRRPPTPAPSKRVRRVR